jgi:phospholipid/cholesterol/gamma-HCH transport system permease protein
MSDVAAGPPPSAPPERPSVPVGSRRRLKVVSGPYRIVMEAGRIGQFAGHVLGDAVSRPRGYWKSVRDESYLLVKLCWWPMAISTFAFGFGAPGIQGVNVFALLGIPDRLGSFFVLASVREFGPFVTAIVVAGVVGSAYTSDLGSRRIREEIDAMEVLGVDATRELVLPRIIACTLMTGLLDVLALTVGIVGGLAAATLYGANYAAFLSNLFANSTTIDLAGGFIKTLLFGLIIAVVCCYKGLSAQGGPIGVGRAVNQAVVIAFVAIFVVDYAFTATMLGLFPEIQVYR